MRLAGQRVVVVGLGASGRAAARVCAEHGAHVVGVDVRATVEPIPEVRVELGPHRRETFLAADLIVVSPGVPTNQPDLVAAHHAGIQVEGELGFASSLVPDLPILGVTGTNGKSTVTSFCGQILLEAGVRAFVGGNLGRPLSEAVPAPGQRCAYEVAVVECSSYQLERAGALRARAGAFLNLTEDHLARHGSMEAYADAKARLFANQEPDDLALIADDPRVMAAVDRVGRGVRGVLGGSPGIQLNERRARIELPGLCADLDLSELSVPGQHNRWNAAVAATLALWFGVPQDVVQRAIGSLRALAHRMEVVSERGGLLWINDSKATNVDAAMVGITGCERPAVVLLGGEAKGPGFAALAPHLTRHRAVVTFGGSGEAIATELESVGVSSQRAVHLRDAVDLAARLAHPGDAVLLSPGCASFDAFDNFEHRGRVFSELAREDAP